MTSIRAHYNMFCVLLQAVSLVCNITYLVTGKFILFQTAKYFIRVYVNVVPMVIYKRKRMKIDLTNSGPPRAKAECPMRGLVLVCFIDFVKPTKEETVVFILDSHVNHTKNLAAADMAREAGVGMVSLPPHTTHRFQPLDGAFFGPFGKCYDGALRMWVREHVGRQHGKLPKFLIWHTEKQHPFNMLLVASGRQVRGR